MANRISTTIDTSRKYDIDFITWSDAVTGTAQFKFGSLSKKTTGIVKAANRYLKVLLTRKGSDYFNLMEGTFLEDLLGMGGATDSDIVTFISLQMSDALTQIQKIQTQQELPDDEVITSVVMQSFTRNKSNDVVFVLQIITQAGLYANIKVPIIGG